MKSQILALFAIIGLCQSAMAVEAPVSAPSSENIPRDFPVKVTAVDATVIRYTTDGNDPTVDSPEVVNGGDIMVRRNLVLKAVAWDGAGNASAVTSAVYNVTGMVTGAGAGYHTLGLKSDGKVWGWGRQTYGVLGNGVISGNQLAPVTVMKNATTAFTNGMCVAAGDYHSVILDDQGGVWTCGYNAYGELGNNSTVTTAAGVYPVRVLKSATAGDYLTGIVQVGGGYQFSMGLDESGNVWAWGDNSLSQLGKGDSAGTRLYAGKVKQNATTDLAGIVAISSSHDFAMAVDGGGTVWGWGYNDAGKLGVGNVTEQSYATKVQASAGVDLSNVANVSVGGTHSVFLKGDGTVWCCGQQTYGRLGNGSTVSASITYPVQVVTSISPSTPLTDVIQVAAGPTHTLALKDNGTVWAWGDNSDKQLGDGTTTVSAVAKQVMGLPANVVFVGTGGNEAVSGVPNSSYAITADGTLYAWGYNGYGQLANGNTTLQGTPVAVATGYSFSNGSPQVSLSTEGLIYSPPASLTLNATASDPDGAVVKVDFFQNGGLAGTKTGSPFSLSLSGLTSGNYSFQAVAYDEQGASGSSNTVNVSVAQPVVGVSAYVPSVDENAVTPGVFRISRSAQSSTLEDLSVAYTVAGTATAGTDYAALGGSAVIPQGATFVDVAVDPMADWVTEGDETVQMTLGSSAGYGVSGGAATVTIADVPVAEPVLSPWTAVPGFTDRPVEFNVQVSCETPGAELRYTLDGSEPTISSAEVVSGGVIAIKTNLTLSVKAWDTEGHGSVTAVGNYRATGMVAAGASYALAVKSNGKATGWGLQTNGELGNGLVAAANVTSPAGVLKSPSPGTAFLDAAFISGGASHTLVIDQSKNLWAFGLNTNGQLGVNSVTNNATNGYARQVQKSATAGDYLTNIVSAGAGGTFSVAADTGGNVWAWGLQTNGQLGNGLTTAANVMVAGAVQTLDTQNPMAGIVQVASGYQFSVARSGSGRVWSWGYNLSGQLGTGNATTQAKAVPVKLNGNTPAEYLSDVQDISAGTEHVVALRKLAQDTSTTVWCWGQQSYGRLGNGLTAALAVSYPVQVQKDASEGGGYLQDIVQVAAGSQHNLALDKNGQVWAWGDNGYGALGDGSITDRGYAKRVKLNATTYLDNVVFIAAGGTSSTYGYGFSLALRADGSVVTWGYNLNGQLGNGVNTTAATTYASSSIIGVLNNQSPSGTLGVDGLPGTEGLIYSPPAALTLNATASDPDGSVVRVDFFQNGVLAGTKTGSPFSLSLSGLTSGNYSFQAVAYDEQGASGSSNTVNVSVAQPVVGVSAYVPSVDENAVTPGVFRISRSAQSSTLEDLSVAYTVAGTATAGTDYAALGGSAVIPQGATFVDVAVDPAADWVTEGDETVQMTLGSSASYGVSGGAATVTIVDVPVAKPVLSPWTAVPGFSGRPVEFQVQVSCETPGAELHYTLDGSEPTTSSALVTSGGLIAIKTNLTLSVKAWDTEGHGSVTAVGNYRATGMVAAGASYALAVKSNGKATGWGLQTNGELGNGLVAAASLTSPAGVLKSPSPGTPFLDAAFISAGASHTLVIDQGKNLWAFGLNTNGQLGVNSVTNNATNGYARQVQKSATAGDYLTNIVSAGAGGTFSVAADTGGDVWAWGLQTNGQLGNGLTLAANVMVAGAVQTLDTQNPMSGIVQVASGYQFAVARSGSGRVWSWGYNLSGQLGAGNTTTQAKAVPVKLNGNTPAEYLSDVQDISAGIEHVVALRKLAQDPSTTVWCWGQQSYGRLGNGLTAALAVSYPVQVQKDASEGGGYLQDIVQVAAGSQHNLALDKNGQVWAWGDNGYGALGDGSITDRGYAKRVKLNATTYLDNVVFIAAGGTSSTYGYGFSLALRADGSVVTWGYNYNGQLGNGVNTTTATYASSSAIGVLNNQSPAGTLSVGGSPYFAPAAVTLSVTAADPDGTVSGVDFYQDSLLVASATATPFQTEVPGVGEGNHSFRAIVRDNSGAWTNTNEVSISVILPTVGVAAQLGTIAENSAVPGSFRISRAAGESTAHAINVGFTLSGTATPGEDYEAPEMTAVIPAGAAYMDIPITPLTDLKTDGDESVVLTVEPSSAFHISSAIATVTITESTDPQLADNDGDGMRDVYENANGLDPWVDDSYADKDGDRYPNIFEYFKGTAANDAPSHPAADFVVDPAGSGTQTNIQAALDATGADGQIILVKSGTYRGAGNTGLQFPAAHRVLVLSEDGARSTILDGENTSPLLSVGTGSVIDGFTLRNGSTLNGGAVHVSSGQPYFIDCVFLHNAAGQSGGALYQASGVTHILHGTFLNNSAVNAGQALFAETGAIEVKNSIVWSGQSAAEIAFGAEGTMQADHSLVRGGFPGTGNLSSNPLLTPDGHLQSGSPAIGAGAVLSVSQQDMDGESRVGIPDAGADEWIDTDSDQMPDWWESGNGFDPHADTDAAQDRDGDGLSNLQEYQQGGNPTDYFNQGGTLVTPVLSIVSGNNQAGLPGEYVSQALVVEARNSASNALLVNAPVVFTVAGGTGGLATQIGSQTTGASLPMTTGATGRVQVAFQQGSAASATNTVTARSGTSGFLSFTARTTRSDGLWSEWKFEEGSGTTVSDSTGLTVNGTLTNQPQWSQGFDGRGGMTFNGFPSEGGTKAYVTMGNPADRSLDFGSDSFSIALWVKYADGTFPAGQYGRRIISKGHHGFNPGYTIVLEGDGRLWTGIGSTASSIPLGLFFSTTTEFDDAQWHHVAAVFDRQNSTARIYVDGVAQPLAKYTGSGGTIDPQDPTVINFPTLATLSATRTDMPLTVSSHLGVYDFFKGDVDDVRFYRKALSGPEVADLHNIDGDGDGLPDCWEATHGFDPKNPDEDNDGVSDGLDDFDRDGLSNAVEAGQGSDPKDYFSQGSAPIVPTIAIVGGNNQTGAPGEFLVDPLSVEVRNSANNALLPNAPVVFTVTAGGGGLAMQSGNATTNGTTSVFTGNSTTGTNGVAQARFQGMQTGATNTITAQSGTADPVIFTETTGYGLVGNWKLDETTGTTASDSSGLGNNGTVSNNPSWAAGAFGNGLQVNGSNQTVTVNTSPCLEIGQKSLTLVAWFKSGSSSVVRPILSKEDSDAGGYHGFYLGLDVGGNVEVRMGANSGSSHKLQFSTTENFSDNQWHQVIVSFDRTAALARIIVDGSLRTLQVASGSVGTATGTEVSFSGVQDLNATSTAVLTIGGNPADGTYFSGILDELRVYDQILTDQQILGLTDSDPANELPDAWEIQHFGHVGVSSTGDTDGDGLSNLQECQNGTNPTLYSSGNNATSDGWWVQYGLNPYSATTQDTDGDGRSDSQEFIDGTDPLNQDEAPTSPEIAAAPSDLVEQVNPDGSSDLTWNDNSNNEKIFIIQEKRPDGTWVDIATVPPNTTTFHIPAPTAQ